MKRESTIIENARMALVAYLRQKGMRRTPERFAILEKVFETDSHFFADSLRDILEADGYHVSLSTIYASLHVLVDAGLVTQHRFADQPTQYERVEPSTSGSHYHLVCSLCGKIHEVRDDEKLRELTAVRHTTFRPDYCMVYVYGHCGSCQKRLRKLERQRREAEKARREERRKLSARDGKQSSQ